MKRSNISDNLIVAKISWKHLEDVQKPKRTGKHLVPQPLPLQDNQEDYPNDAPMVTTIRPEITTVRIKAKYLITYETLGGLFKGHVYTDCYTSTENGTLSLEKWQQQDGNCNIDLNLWPDTIYDVLVKDLQKNLITSKLRIDTTTIGEVRSNKNPFVDTPVDQDLETSKMSQKLDILEQLLETDQTLDIEILRDSKASPRTNNLVITIDEFKNQDNQDLQDLFVISEFLDQQAKRSAPSMSKHSGSAPNKIKLEILKSYFLLSLLLLLIVISVVVLVYFCVARERTKNRRKSFLLSTEEV